jgi:hypothetical protein
MNLLKIIITSFPLIHTHYKIFGMTNLSNNSAGTIWNILEEYMTQSGFGGLVVSMLASAT